MFLSEAACGLCLLFLFCTWAAQKAAAQNGDTRRLHNLHLAQLGLGLCACAYLFHSLGKSPGSPLSILSLVFRLGGMTFLWLAWTNHWKLQREQLKAQALTRDLETDAGPELRLTLPPGYHELYSSLNVRAREALCAAQEEALRRHQCCVDTDHLLLGLLQVPHCAASRILERSGVASERLQHSLTGEHSQAAGHCHGDASSLEPDLPAAAALSPRTRQVLAMAEIEAHRFDKTFVGTEHLLLGLLLTGTGPAASALFASGLTVDGIRREILAGRKK